MEKLKLNIQKFASTNKTQYYNLSQYLASDKPTYLVDYNTDMENIDRGIHAAKEQAQNNENNIGSLQSLNTTDKTSIVNSINEVFGISNTNKNNIGDLNLLNTTNKSSIVNAMNENTANINNNALNISKLNLINFANFDTNNINLTQGTFADASFTVASNVDGSVAKVYGATTITLSNYAGVVNLSFQSSLRPTSNIHIASLGEIIYFDNVRGLGNIYPQGINIGRDGVITIGFNVTTDIINIRINIHPCLLFVKDFGDKPNQQN